MKKHLYWICVWFLLGLKTISYSKLISCIGDSITWGSGASDKFQTSYPSLLQKLLNFPHIYQLSQNLQIKIENFGVRASTMQRCGSKSYWNSSEYLQSKNCEASIIVIQLGTNDARNNSCWDENKFKQDYLDMIKNFLNKNHPQIFISIPPPLYSDSGVYGLQKNIINKELPRVIPLIAQEANSIIRSMNSPHPEVRVIDIFSSLGGEALSKRIFFEDVKLPWKEELIFDGCHPNDLGYLQMALTVGQSILGESLPKKGKRKFIEEQLRLFPLGSRVEPSIFI